MKKLFLPGFVTIFLLALVGSFVLSGYAIGSADLVVREISFSSTNPTAGENVTVSATILNQGPGDASRFYVRLYVDGVRKHYRQIPFGLDSGETDTVEFSWTAVSGQHEIKVVADEPFDKVSEYNEQNNAYRQSISVLSGSSVSGASELKVAVASFTDKSNSGFANVSNGVADLVVQNLVNSGFQTLERQQLESVLLEQQFNPVNTSQLAQATRIAGADALVAGSVTNIDVNKTMLNLGFLSVTGVTVTVDLSYRVISAYTSQILGAQSVTAKAEGETDASFRIGTMLNSLSQVSQNVCGGGLRTSKNVYYQGEVITVGYLDPFPPSSLTIQFSNASGPIGPSLFSNFKTTSGGNRCATWSWNPSGTLPPGTYSVDLYSWPPSSPIASKGFQVSGGVAPPNWVGQVTFGTQQFQDSIVGDAVEKALTKMSTSLVNTLNNSTPTLLNQREQYTQPQPSEQPEEQEPEQGQPLQCRIVSMESDDKVILAGIERECGKNAGIQEDDIFYIYPASEVIDPSTGNVIEIIPKTDQPSGKIIILNVYDKISRAQLIGSFNINVGDLAILKE